MKEVSFAKSCTHQAEVLVSIDTYRRRYLRVECGVSNLPPSPSFESGVGWVEVERQFLKIFAKKMLSSVLQNCRCANGP